jgi:hypothetical protein
MEEPPILVGKAEDACLRFVVARIGGKRQSKGDDTRRKQAWAPVGLHQIRGQAESRADRLAEWSPRPRAAHRSPQAKGGHDPSPRGGTRWR